MPTTTPTATTPTATIPTATIRTTTVPTLVVRLLAVLVLTGGIAVAGADPAAGGGPTSVLLASPYSAAAAAFYYSDDGYTRLQDLVGGSDPTEPIASAGSPPAGMTGGPYVTVTWLIHDVAVWRLDRIFLPISTAGRPAPAEVWIGTELPTGDQPIGSLSPDLSGTGVVWHRAADPSALTALLAELGLVPGSTPPADLVAAIPAEPAPADRSPAEPAPAGSGLPWALGGLIVGLVVGGGIVGLTARRRPDPVTPTDDPAGMQPIGAPGPR